MKALLTSAGFENPLLTKLFLDMVGKKANGMKVVFVPTAAIHPDAIAMLPKCMNDLLSAGIPKENVTVYDLHRAMPRSALRAHDAVYFCGGDSDYLIRRINDSGFRRRLLGFVRSGGVYVGVSAGSCVAARNVKRGLAFVDVALRVHCEQGARPGPLANAGDGGVCLTNRQAILIDGERQEIVG